MAKLLILYGPPKTRPRLRITTRRHIPYASGHMPNVVGAENLRIVAAADVDAPRYYRVSWLTYERLADFRAGADSQPGRAVLADLENFADGGATILMGEEG